MRQTLRIIGQSLPTGLIAGVLSTLLMALLGLPAAALAQSDAKVTGEVLYRERIALPPSAFRILRASP